MNKEKSRQSKIEALINLLREAVNDSNKLGLFLAQLTIDAPFLSKEETNRLVFEYEKLTGEKVI